ncbi:MAG: hypothetical protein ACFFC7_00515 [Candidatus Hermodarchaeota archaeon]
MSSGNSFLFSTIEFPIDICLVFPLYLEDYWLLREVEKLQMIYPNIEWIGLFDPTVISNYTDLEFYLPKNSIFNFGKQKNKQLWAIEKITTFKEASESNLQSNIQSIVSNSPFFVVSPTHIVSRFRFHFLRKKYPRLRAISIDAHDDVSSGLEIENLWVSRDLLPFTGYIGPKNLETSQFLFQSETIVSAVENRFFTENIQNKPIFLSIDLDFFSQNAFGIASHWFRQLFIGHSLNIRQRLEHTLFSSPPGSEYENFNVGEKLGFFEKGQSLIFLKNREKQIIQEVEALEKAIFVLLQKLESLSCSIVGIDITEVCSLGDVNEKTVSCLKKVVLKIQKFIEVSN